MRPTMSTELPGVNEMMRCTGLFGKPCACVLRAPAASIAKTVALRSFMWFLRSLLGPCACVAHHFAEYLVLLANEAVELLRRHLHRLAAELFEPILHLVGAQCPADFAVQLDYDFPRRPGRGQDADPEIELAASISCFPDGRHRRQCRDAARSADRERQQLPVFQGSHAGQAGHPGKMQTSAHGFA